MTKLQHRDSAEIMLRGHIGQMVTLNQLVTCSSMENRSSPVHNLRVDKLYKT